MADLKDLKIISKTELEEAKNDFGILLRSIEYYSNNPNTKRVDILRILKMSIEFRDTLTKL